MRSVVALFAALGLVLAACGGDDTIPKEEYIAQADAICKAADDELDALDDPSGLDELVDQAEQAREVYQRLAEDIAELDDPDEDAEAIEELFGILDDLVAAVDDLLVAAEDKDAEALSEAGDRLDELSADAQVRAAELGFEECGVDTEAGDVDPVEDDAVDPAAEFDLADYPPDLEPDDDEVALLAPVISEQANGLFTDEEVDCMVRFVLSRVTLAEMEPVARQLGEAAALECVSAERLVEIGIEANAEENGDAADGPTDEGSDADEEPGAG